VDKGRCVTDVDHLLNGQGSGRLILHSIHTCDTRRVDPHDPASHVITELREGTPFSQLLLIKPAHTPSWSRPSRIKKRPLSAHSSFCLKTSCRRVQKPDTDTLCRKPPHPTPQRPIPDSWHTICSSTS
jgi:hypothetical protein